MTQFKMPLFMIGLCSGLFGCKTTPQQQEPEVFIPLSVVERAAIVNVQSIGRVIYDKDVRAAQATDLLLSKIDPRDHPNFVGWVTYRNDSDYTVSFYEQLAPSQFTIIADVIYQSFNETPKLVIAPNRKVGATEVSMIKARISALESSVNRCSERFNTVVLQGQEADTWQVYVLAANTNPTLVQIGGHTRVVVSKASGEIENSQRLSKSCLVLSLTPDDMPPGATLSMLTMSHIISDTPVEIHPYLNLLHDIGLAVMTQRGVWIIEDGNISLMDASKN